MARAAGKRKDNAIMVNMIPIRVLLADDHTILRQGLRRLLESHSDITVVGDADNGPGSFSFPEFRPI